jgi:hypothetical protein
MLASTGITLIAGCSSEDTADDSSSSGSDPEPEPTPVTIVDRSEVVDEDEYTYWEVPLERSASLSLSATVRSGPNIDIVFMNQSEFTEFEQGNRFRYSSDLSLLDTVGDDVSASVEAGDYILLLDNTARIEAAPPTNLSDDAAEVDISLIAE